MESISFNSKSARGFQGLSNLMGGAEFDYMGARFPQQALKDLFERLKNCDRETFLEWLQLLQPGKEWSDNKLKYWFTRSGEPIRGILAQMLGSMVRCGKDGKLTKTSKGRRAVVCEQLGLAQIEVVDELSSEDKKALMKKCLLRKYDSGPYRTLLLSTGSDELHERPMRGKKNAWTSPGGDWLGQLLMEVREELGVAPDDSAEPTAKRAKFSQYVEQVTML